MNEPTHVDLFSGIGGFALAAQWAGFRTIAFCEIDESASDVLSSNFPGIHNIGDIRNFDTIPADLFTGGIPCQPFSSASSGKRRGKEDHRYLWPEMLRVIKNSEPTWVLFENVTHIDGVALSEVESDLEGIGYEVGALEIPACAVGCDHRRRRIWILGYSDSDSKSRLPVNAEMAGLQKYKCVGKAKHQTHGVPARMDEWKKRELIGNAIVPQVAYEILREIRNLI